MTDRDPESGSRSPGPVGTLLGATLGPFGAAVGSVVDENRFAFKLTVGSNASNDDDRSLEDGATIEIEDDEDATVDGRDVDDTDDAMDGDRATTERETDDAAE